MCFEKPEELLDLLQSYTGNIEVIHPYVHADCRKRLINEEKEAVKIQLEEVRRSREEYHLIGC